MAEKKPAAKKPAAKAPAKKPAAKAPVEKKVAPRSADPAKTRISSGQFDENGLEIPMSKKVGKGYVEEPRTGGSARPTGNKIALPGSAARGGVVDAPKGMSAAEKAANRSKLGAPATPVAAPKPAVNRRGNLAKAGEVVTTPVKRTSTVRAGERKAAAKEQAKADFLKDRTVGPGRIGAPEDVTAYSTDKASVYHPAGWSLNSPTPHTKMMGKINEMSAMIGRLGENLPDVPGVTAEFRQNAADKLSSAVLSHNEARGHAMNGQPVAALRRAREAHETLQSLALDLQGTLGSTRKFSTKSFGRLVNRHGDILNRTITDQKSNDKEFDVPSTRLRDENDPIKSGRFAGTPRIQNPGDNVSYERNPNRARFNHSSVVSVANIAATHSLDPQTRAIGASAIAHSKAFGDAVANGDKQAVVGHGRALNAHLDALYSAAKNREATTVTNTPQMQETVLTNLRKHISAAKQGVAMFTGER